MRPSKEFRKALKKEAAEKAAAREAALARIEFAEIYEFENPERLSGAEARALGLGFAEIH
jgi:hypothetical protein